MLGALATHAFKERKEKRTMSLYGESQFVTHRSSQNPCNWSMEGCHRSMLDRQSCEMASVSRASF